ncbi:MAG: DnaJ domain-containing protein [Candidatus Gastranaerophilales bacterium]|nr:DnaJ domain-containing protein [Candidatus Gastranaerophilales bacterium]
MRDFEDYKKILKIKGKYDEDSLKKAYHDAVKNNHPDRFNNPINKKLATEKMKLINEAYEYLKKNMDNQPSDKEFQGEYNRNHNSRENDTKNEKQQNSNIIKDLELFIKNHTIVTICYRLETGATVNLKILPLELEQGLYLKALFCAESQVKTYRVDRIISVSADNGEKQERKDYDNYNKTEEESTVSEKNIWNLTVILPIITALIIVLSFFKVPYQVYILLRIFVCLTLFNMLVSLRKFIPIWAVLLCIGGIILYNPVYLVRLSKAIWQILDMGLLFFILWLLKGYFKDE